MLMSLSFRLVTSPIILTYTILKFYQRLVSKSCQTTFNNLNGNQLNYSYDKVEGELGGRGKLGGRGELGEEG